MISLWILNIAVFFARTEGSKIFLPPIHSMPPAQKILPPLSSEWVDADGVTPEMNPVVLKAKKKFQEASALQSQKKFAQALKAWRSFLMEYAALPTADWAKLNASLCAMSLRDYQTASHFLKELVETYSEEKSKYEFAGASRILLSQILLEQKKTDEALALTFEVWSGGNQKAKTVIDSTFDQKLRALLLRAQIYSYLNKFDLSDQALNQAEELFSASGNLKNEKWLAQKYWQERALVLGNICKNTNQIGTTFDEKAWLDYSSKYFTCLRGLRKPLCELAKWGIDSVFDQVRWTYKELVYYPKSKEFKKAPPTRMVLTQQQRKFFETELSLLREKDIQENATKLKHLEECGLYDLY